MTGARPFFHKQNTKVIGYGLRILLVYLFRDLSSSFLNYTGNVYNWKKYFDFVFRRGKRNRQFINQGELLSG